jgi:hypothetical protein
VSQFVEQADVEAIVASVLRAAGITNLVGVYSSIPKDPTFPLITVQRIGGFSPVREYLDAANIQIDVWGGSKSEAFDIAARARLVLLGLAGTQVPSPVSAWVSAVEDSLGVTWQPDPSTGRDRYLFSVLVYARAADGVTVASGYGGGGYGA